MSVTYDQVKALLHSEDFMNLIPDGYSLSQPILSKIDNTVVDNFFVSSRNNGILTPIYNFGLCYDTKSVVYINEILDAEIPADATSSIGISLAEFEKYKELYGRIRDMFENDYVDDVSSLTEYAIILFKLIPEYLMDYYNALSKEFFEFFNKNL